MSAGAPVWKIVAVWVARVISGATFAVSGWAKCVDPSGFVYKIEEYLRVWGIGEYFPREVILVCGVGLSLFELITGILLLTGSLRRSAPVCGLLMMLGMLPLTAYIAVANPVSDCGCFGDLLVVSNGITFVKNLVLTALLVVCLIWSKAAMPLYRPGLQWVVVALTALYGMLVAAIGWQLQPIVDFRPFGVGKPLIADLDEAPSTYIYEKDGTTSEFALDALPDSTWTFVEAVASTDAASDHSLAVFDEDGFEVSDELFGDDACGQMLLFVVAEPGVSNLTRSRMANELAEYSASHDIPMIGLIAASGRGLQQWRDITMPAFDTYSASDTSLKQLVRGRLGLVLIDNGRVVWKRNFTTIDPDFLSQQDPLRSLFIVDDGRLAILLSGSFIVCMLLLLAISALTKINFHPRRKNKDVPTD